MVYVFHAGSKMDIYDNRIGKKYLIIAFIVMFIVQLVEILFTLSFNEIKSYIPKSCITIVLLVAWFYCIAEGFRTAKWIFVLVCIYTGIHSLYNGYIFFIDERIIYDNVIVIEKGFLAKFYAVQLITNGTIKLFFACLLIFSKNINIYIRKNRDKRSTFSKKESIGNILSILGYTISISTISWFFVASLINTIYNPKMIVGFLILTPLKMPLYAIPGIIIVLLGKFITGDKKTT